MRSVAIVSALMVLGFNLTAQNAIDNVLTEVEKNNTSLQALRKSIDAQIIGNRTGLAPQNPEVEFNYLWGSPSVIGNRTDISVRQSFDFPTVYSYKLQISDLKNQQAELEYRKQRNEVLHQARIACVQLILHNALSVELTKRHANALQIANAYKAKYDAGEAGILEHNKAQVNLLNAVKEVEVNGVERNALLLELARLNGGVPIQLTDSLLATPALPAEFDQWFAQAEANNPLLQWVKQEVAILGKQVQLNAAMGLPKFYGGFMSEKVAGQQFQGLTVGITIPLWENRNTVRHARAKAASMQSVETDARLQFYNSMKAAHAKALALQNIVTDYRNKLAMHSNSELLEKVFSRGEISLTEYMFELSLYYESIYKLLEMEMNLNMAIAELNRYQ